MVSEVSLYNNKLTDLVYLFLSSPLEAETTPLQMRADKPGPVEMEFAGVHGKSSKRQMLNRGHG